MKRKERDYITVTVIICAIFSILTVFLWFFLSWVILLILLPLTIFIELFLLQWIDQRHIIREKQKLIHLGIISPSDTQMASSETKDEFDQLKNFVRLNLIDLNELLVNLEEGYREALEQLDLGEIEDAKFRFISLSKDIKNKYKEREEEVDNLFEEFPIPTDIQKRFLYDSYKENWNSEKQKSLERINEIINKFKVRSEYSLHIEDILQFEVKNERVITDKDIKNMKVPYHQAKQLIKFIEKPINLRIEDLSAKEKQKYGLLGRKIIETCSQNQITPNLPYLSVKLGITIQEAKKILTYLYAIGMIENIYYHYVKKEI